MTEQQVEIVEQQNEIRASGEPLLKVRARTQIVVMGWVRYMGESFDLPQRQALGLVGIGLADQVIDPRRPLTWQQNAPGPHEPFALPGDFAVQGSREGGTETRGGEPGDQQDRQQSAAQNASDLQPQLLAPNAATRDEKPPVEPTTDTGTFRGAHPPRRHPPSPVRAAPRQ